MDLNPKAQSLLLNICKLYAASPSQTVFSTDTPVLLNYSNSFFYELENAGYITFTDNVVPTFEVLDKTISYAHEIDLI